MKLPMITTIKKIHKHQIAKSLKIFLIVFGSMLSTIFPKYNYQFLISPGTLCYILGIFSFILELYFRPDEEEPIQLSFLDGDIQIRLTKRIKLILNTTVFIIILFAGWMYIKI